MRAGTSDEQEHRPRILRLLQANGRVAWQLVGVAVVVWILGQVFAVLQPVLLSVFTALVLGAVAGPVAQRLERIGLPRALSAGVGLLLTVAVLGGALTYVGVRLVEELPALVEDLEAQRQPVLDLLAREPLSLSEQEVMAVLDRGIEQAAQPEGETSAPPEDPQQEAELDGDGEGPEPRLTVALLRGAVETTRSLGFGVIGIVLAFFLVRDRDLITDGIVTFAAGGRYDTTAYAVLRRGWRALLGYVRGSLLVGAIDAALIGAALFALGVPLAGVLTVLTFVGGFVPVVGATVAGVLAAGVTALSINVGAGLGMLAWIIVVQQLDGHVLQPVVMKRETNLHPVATILALTVGGIIGGIVGALLAVPVAAVLTNVAAELLSAADEGRADAETPAAAADGASADINPTSSG